jgi:hypothetical protein
LKRGVLAIPQDAVCSFCDTETESMMHLFFECGLVVRVWEAVFSWFGVDITVQHYFIGMKDHFESIVYGRVAKNAVNMVWVCAGLFGRLEMF